MPDDNTTTVDSVALERLTSGGAYACYVVAVLMFAYIVAIVDGQILSLLLKLERHRQERQGFSPADPDGRQRKCAGSRQPRVIQRNTWDPSWPPLKQWERPQGRQ